MTLTGRWLTRALSAAAVLLAAALAACLGAPSALALNLRQLPSAHAAHHAPGLRSSAPTPQALDRATRQVTGLQPSQVAARDVCAAPEPGRAGCLAQVVVDRSSHRLVHPRPAARRTFTQVFPRRPAHHVAPAAGTSSGPAAAPSAGTPAYLQQAYDLTYLSQTAGAADTVAIVDAGDDPNAETDLAAYRSHFGLSPCTTANGCFAKVNQSGQPSPLPAAVPGWREEESLDLDAVSALCPNCHILFVVTNSNSMTDLDTGVTQAQALGADQISASWGGDSASPVGAGSFPGANLIAATGDTGYAGAGSASYPAGFPGVTAVGATTLSAATPTPRGYTESAWSVTGGAGGGSGCATAEAKPAFQSDSGCTGRSYSDVSADGNPSTGLSVYDAADGGWLVIGGTSLATPLTAAFEAVTGITATDARWAYADSALLNDPISGSTGSCSPSIGYICTAGTGYDGPTGIGSISGDVAPGAPGIGGPGAGGGYAQAVGTTTAGLAGGVYPNGLDTQYHWEWGTTTAYGSQTPATDAGAGALPVSTPASLTGLQASTTYHYRLVAANADGTAYGYDYTLTTASAGAVAPVNTTAPQVGGTVAQGQTLTASTGSWSPAPSSYAYQWQRSTNAGATWTTIAGAAGQTYTVVAGDLNDELRVTVTANDAWGSTAITSVLAGPVASGAPVNAAYPTITGTARQGQALTADPGTWTPAAGTDAYQWQQSTDGGGTWSDVAGATGATYSVIAPDLGLDLRVTVTASNAFGSGTATSAPVGPVASGAPVNTVAPSISGTPNQGQVLSVVATWDPAASAYAYRWQQSTDGGATWSDVAGQTGATYTLGAADVGHRLRVAVTATNAYGQASATSAGVGPVASTQPTPVSAPTVSGTTQRTYALSATSGSWTGPNLAYAYQWQRSADGGSTWTSITAATNAGYTLGVADEGDELRVVVSASNATGVASQASAGSQVIAPYPPANTTAPAVSGTAKRGRTLNATRGTWTGPDNDYAYQWQEDFGEGYVDIPGATSAAYTLQTGDEGDTVRVVVSATNPDGPIVAASQPTATVTPDVPVNDTPPSIAGSAQRGSTLTAAYGTWEGQGDVTTYQWQRSTDSGASWSDVAGQTGAGYTIGVGDEGAQLRVVVTATNPDGSATLPSAATSTIPPAPPVSTATPTIAGAAQRGQTLTADPGGWDGIANAYADRWQRSADGGTTWTNIAGATGATYALAVADEGDVVRVLVTATNPDGVAGAASQASATVAAAPPANTNLPQVAGTARRSSTLSASVGAWSGLDNAYTCQWQRSGDGGTTWTNIAGATNWSYPLGVADEGALVRARVTAANDDGSTSVTTAPTATVAGAPPVATTAPQIAGAASRGAVLTSTGGAWDGIGNSYADQWQRSGDGGTTWTNIAGATGATYPLTVADEGDLVRLLVTASNPDATVAAASAATATVTASAPSQSAPPTIGGTAQRGSALTGTQGGWNGNGNGYADQWQRSTDGGTTWVDVARATGLTYVPSVGDEGSALRLRVSATNVDGAAVATSAATPTVVATPPAVSVAPTLTGTAARASQLTGTQGSWTGVGNTFTYAWQRSADGSTWTNIAGAANLTYTVTAADEGDRLRLQVTATNPDATVSAATAATAVVPAAPPAGTAPPTISGAAQRGTTLGSNPGTWNGIGNVYADQWQRSADGATWTNIAGATAGTYTLTVADEGSTVRLLVTASNPDGSVSVPSAPTGVVQGAAPVNVSAPTISGAATRTATLTSTPGTWSGADNFALYQWQRSADGGSTWTNIAGATGNAYTLTVTDEGSTVRLLVSESNPDGAATAASGASAVVATAPPVNTALPAVPGTPRRTVALVATAGMWGGVGNVYAYQWQRSPDGSGWSDVTGATTTAYTPVAADEGQRLRLVVSASNPDGTVAAASPASPVVLGAPPINTHLPVISGSPRLAATLDATTGAWTPDATAFAYQWQRCDTAGQSCQPISGATSSSYTLAAADVSATVRVAVTATNPDGSATASSDATATVAQPPRAVTPPTAPAGTLMDASTLTADHGSWDTPASYTYAWVRCPDGATAVTPACDSVGTGSTYALSAADIGSEIAVRVTAASVGGTTTVVSPLTATVTGRPETNTTAPGITGNPFPPHVLAADAGTWSVPPQSTSYVWERCDADGVSDCTQVSAAATYALTGADEGHTLLVIVTVTSPGHTATARSAALTVQNQPLPSPSAQPAISGTAARGSALTASTGTWTNSPTSLAIDWERCSASGQACQAIAGANRTAYTPTRDDEGSTLTVVVTAANAEGSGTATATPTAVVAASPPQITHQPALSARPQQGTAVAVQGLSWAATVDTTYATTWQRCDAAGHGCQVVSTGATYTPPAADVGHTLIATVTASNVDGAVPAVTPASATILPAAPRWRELPVLSAADDHVGTTVNVIPGTWSGPAVTTDTVELMRCTNVCVPDATAASYTIAAADTGAILRVRETAVNGGGTTIVWSAQYVGPVASLASASAVLGSRPVTLRNYAGTALATARLQAGVGTSGVSGVSAHAVSLARRRAARRRVLVIRRAAAIRTRLRAWACPVAVRRGGGGPLPCSRRITLARTGRLVLPATMTGRVRIVVVRTKR